MTIDVAHRSRKVPSRPAVVVPEVDLPAEVVRHLSELFPNSQALSRALSVVDALSRHEFPVDRVTLAAELGMVRLSPDRILRVLVTHGYVFRTARFGTSMGPRFLSYGTRFPNHLHRTVSPVVAPYMTEFFEQTGLPAFFAVHISDGVAVTDSVGVVPAEVEVMPAVNVATRRASRDAWLGARSGRQVLHSTVWSAPAASGWTATVARVNTSTSYACVGMLLDDRVDVDFDAANARLVALSHQLTRALGRRFPRRG